MIRSILSAKRFLNKKNEEIKAIEKKQMDCLKELEKLNQVLKSLDRKE